MMVPRTYQYTSMRAEAHSCHHGSGPEAPSKLREDKRRCKTRPSASRPPTGLLPAPSTTSQPMVIPTRTKDQETRTPNRRPLNEKVTEKDANGDLGAHPKSASLAVYRISNSIPLRRSRKDNGRAQGVESHGRSMSSSSPQAWNLLLSAPDETPDDCGSLESEATLGPASISTESMPSLDEDQSSISSASIPATPGFGGERRRQKSLSTSLGQDCALDHPLLPQQVSSSVIAEIDDGEEASEISSLSGPVPRSITSFKSNLTASFRAMRSAAKSITDLAPPIRDDLLSRSILSLEVPYTSERRPTTSSEVPDAALRRYLNPMRLSPSELHFHSGDPEDSSSACKSAVQLQSYRPGHRRSPHASSPPIFLSASETRSQSNSNDRKQHHRLEKNALDTEDPLTSSLLPKQREPRENSDFLRVIVLEMNMRKVGKISDANPGRARLWLPAREMVTSKPADEEEEEVYTESGSGGDDASQRRQSKEYRGGSGGKVGKVPSRWVALRP